jgi:hypothetical protein
MTARAEHAYRFGCCTAGADAPIHHGPEKAALASPSIPMAAALEVKQSMEMDIATRRGNAARALRTMIRTATSTAEQLEKGGIDAPYSSVDFVSQDAAKYAEALTSLNAIADQYRAVLWMIGQAIVAGKADEA